MLAMRPPKVPLAWQVGAEARKLGLKRELETDVPASCVHPGPSSMPCSH